MSTISYPDVLRAVYKIMLDGKQYKVKELLPKVQEECGYTNEQMAELTKGGGKSRVEEYVRWTQTHLYGSGLIMKVSWGNYQIVPQRDDLLAMNSADFEKLVRRIFDERKSKKENPKNVNQGARYDQKTIDKVTKLLPHISEEGNRWMLHSLGFISTAPELQSIITGLTTLLADAKDAGYDIDLNELQKNVDLERNKKYELILEIKKKGPDISKVNIYIGEVGCKIEERILIKLEPQPKSIYLSFLYEGSLGLWDFCKASESEGGTYRKIYLGMPGRKIRKEDISPIRNGYNGDDEQLNQIIAKINNAISKALGNDRIARQFAIVEGVDGDFNYGVRFSNQDIKDTIKKHFRLA